MKGSKVLPDKRRLLFRKSPAPTNIQLNTEQSRGRRVGNSVGIENLNLKIWKCQQRHWTWTEAADAAPAPDPSIFSYVHAPLSLQLCSWEPEVVGDAEVVIRLTPFGWRGEGNYWPLIGERRQ